MKESFLFFLVAGLLGFGFSQNPSKNYRELSMYADTMKITFPKIGSLIQNASKLNPNHSDSLALVLFPVLERREMSIRHQIFAHQQMAVMAYQLMGELALADQHQRREIELIKTTSDSSYLMMAYSRLMFIELDLQKQVEAFKTSLKVVRLLEKEPDGINKSFALRQLCVFYNSINDYNRSREYCNQGLNHNRRIRINRYNNDFYEILVGMADNDLISYQEGIQIRKKALNYAKRSEDTLGMNAIFMGLAKSYAEHDQADSAMKYYELSLATHLKSPFIFGWVETIANYGIFLVEQREHMRAQELLDTLHQLQAKKRLNPKAQKAYYKFGIFYHASLGNKEAFYDYYQDRDSLMLDEFNEARLKAQEELAARYETQKKESENALLKAKNRDKKIAIGILALLVVLLAALVIQSFRVRVKDKQLHRSIKEKLELESNFAKRRLRKLQEELEEKIKQAYKYQVINMELMKLLRDLEKVDDPAKWGEVTSQMKKIIRSKLSQHHLVEILNKMTVLYPDLFAWLRRKLGKTNEVEMLVVSMYFVGYSTNDISLLVHRTEKAVRSIRYRVRKKLQLEENIDLESFLVQKNEEFSP